MWGVIRIVVGYILKIWAVVGPMLGFAGRVIQTTVSTFLAAIAGSKLAVTIIFLGICGLMLIGVSSIIQVAIRQVINHATASIPRFSGFGVGLVSAYLPVDDITDFVAFCLSTWLSYGIFLSSSFGIRLLAALYSLLTRAFKV